LVGRCGLEPPPVKDLIYSQTAVSKRLYLPLEKHTRLRSNCGPRTMYLENVFI